MSSIFPLKKVFQVTPLQNLTVHKQETRKKKKKKKKKKIFFSGILDLRVT